MMILRRFTRFSLRDSSEKFPSKYSLASASSHFATPNNVAFFRQYSTRRVRSSRPRIKNPTGHLISSLRPDRISSADFIDLTSGVQLRARFYPKEQPMRLQYRNGVPFPPSARGYLYYAPPPARAPLGGSIRLRVNSDDALGSDLLLPNGLPWQIELPRIVHYPDAAGLLRKLLEEGLVTPETVEECKQIFPPSRKSLPIRLLFHLGQLLYLDMQQAEMRLTIVGRKKVALFVKQRLFGDPAPRYPFKGGIHARFELSAGDDRIFMRVVKIISPVECVESGYEGRIVQPREGELLSYRDQGVVAPWSVSLDSGTSMTDALCLLLDVPSRRPRIKNSTGHLISSLRPDRISSADFIDLTSGVQLHARFYPKERPVRLKYSNDMPFPPNARGYLYYSPPPARAPLGGSVRLRVSSDDADLLLPNGLPWQIELPRIVHYPDAAGLLRKLLEEGLVTPETVEECKQTFPPSRKLLPRHLLFHLGQLFYIDMQQTMMRLTIVGRKKVALFVKQPPFGAPPRYPFKGGIHARFELSERRDRIFIRIVKIASPVECVGPGYEGRIVQPREGELISYRNQGVVAPWSVSLDSGTMTDALCLLLDT